MTDTKKVITFPVGGWTFWDVVYGNGNSPMEDWYSGLSDDASEIFDNLLKNDSKTENHQDWLLFKGFLKGGQFKKERIWEGGFFADGRQYRVFARFGDERRQVLLLNGCYHKQKVYHPPDALDTALKIVKAWRERKMVLRARPIRTDI